MSKIEKSVLALQALLVDASVQCNGLTDLSRDIITEVEHLVRTRGINVLMIDLPSLGKFIESGLEDSVLTTSDFPPVFGTWARQSRKAKPNFAYRLVSILYDRDGIKRNLEHETETETVFFVRQLCYLFKKVVEPAPEDAIRMAVQTFLDIEEELRDPSLGWDSSVDLNPNSQLHLTDADSECGHDHYPVGLLDLAQQVSDLVSREFSHNLDLNDIMPGHGPGAVSDRVSGDKFSFDFWPSKLDSVFPWDVYSVHNFNGCLCPDAEEPSVYEPCARLIAVPKTIDKPRMIASEPTAHQFLQQGLMKAIRHAMRKTSYLPQMINFQDQTPSQALAIEASRIDREIGDEIATVDLSSASDRLTCWTVERVFRKAPNLLTALWATRTRTITDGTGTCANFPMLLNMRKFAAQGSAVTFPIQTIVYTTFAIAAVLYDKLRLRNHHSDQVIRSAIRENEWLLERIQVFGDDIILPSSSVPYLEFLLTHCQLEVNKKKSFTKGPFREACGMDAWCGSDVTPGYLRHFTLDHKPDAKTMVSWIEVSNNFYSKGLWNLASWMDDQIPQGMRHLIPVSDKDLACLALKTFCTGTVGCKRRTSMHLHREELLALQPTTQAQLQKRKGWRNLLQYFLDKPSEETRWESGYLSSTSLRLRKRWVTPHGD